MSSRFNRNYHDDEPPISHAPFNPATASAEERAALVKLALSHRRHRKAPKPVTVARQRGPGSGSHPLVDLRARKLTTKYGMANYMRQWRALGRDKSRPQ